MVRIKVGNMYVESVLHMRKQTDPYQSIKLGNNKRNALLMKNKKFIAYVLDLTGGEVENV